LNFSFKKIYYVDKRVNLISSKLKGDKLLLREYRERVS